MEGRFWCDVRITPKSTPTAPVNRHSEPTPQPATEAQGHPDPPESAAEAQGHPDPPESRAEAQGAAGDLEQVLEGQVCTGKKRLFQCFGCKSNYPIIVLCELASPPQMVLLCNSCWVQKALNVLLCPVASHQSEGWAVHPSSP